MKVRAVVVDPQERGRLALREVDAPQPGPAEALVRVSAFSLNLGEVRGAMTAPLGARPGWDLAGVVEVAASDGTGLSAGTRAVGLVRSGAWAELAAVPTNALAALPDGVSFRDAATLPVAGLTALHAVERGHGLLGNRALVTGASGGVGLYACQLAHLSGARVVALFRQASYVPVVQAALADEVVVSPDAAAARAHGPFRLIVESVGGPVLAEALSMLAPDGVCVSFGATAGADVTFNLWSLARAGRASLYGLVLFNELAREPASVGLERLAYLLSAGRLRPHVALEEQWTKIGEAAAQLLNRRVPGKVVLHVSP